MRQRNYSYSYFQDDDDEVTSFAVSPDNKVLVTATKSLLLHKFSIPEKSFVDRWKVNHKTHVLVMTFDASSTLVVTGSSDSTVKVYDTLKKYCTHNFKGATSPVTLLKFHTDASRLTLFTAYTDGDIRMWDLKTSKCLSILKGHLSAVTSLVLTSDNSMVTTGRDKVLIMWDLTERKLVKTLPIYETVESAVCVPSCDGDGKDEFVVVTAGESGYLRKFGLPTGRCLKADAKYATAMQEGGEKRPAFTHMQYDAENEQLICVTYDHNIVFYNTATLNPEKQFIGYYDEIVDIKLFGEKQDHVVVASNSEQIKVFHRDRVSASEVITGHTDIVLAVDVSHDGKYIAACSKDNSLSVWCRDTESGKFCCVATGKGHTHHVCDVAWSQTTTDYLVSCSKDLTVKCWKLPQLLVRGETVELGVVWTEKAHEKDINVVTVSPNDKLVVSAAQDKTAKVWKLKSGRHVGVLKGHKRGIWCAVFSPVDRCIATGSVDSTIKLWALSNMTCVKTFEGHSNSVLRLAFINRGMQLVSSSSEGLLKVWSVRDDECVATIEGHDDKVWAMTLDKTEQLLVSGGADSQIKFWRDITDETVAAQRKEEETKIQKEQEMSNLIEMGQFDKAVQLAIALNHPRRAFKVFQLILDGVSGTTTLTEVISALEGSYLESLLDYLCEWNTNARNSFTAQSILSIVLRTRGHEELLELPKMKDIIESLLPYTERHYERVNRLVQQSMFVNYSWDCMKLSSMDDLPVSRGSVIDME